MGPTRAEPPPDALPAISPVAAYRLRWKRRRRLWRAVRSRQALTPVVDRTRRIAGDAILGFLCLRNEDARLPHLLRHYRGLGVDHFLVVDNDSDDATPARLADQPDVSLWRTDASYRGSGFGIDWINWLLTRYGAGHWCLTVDADELLVWPDALPDLPALTARLSALGRPAYGAVMLDLFPRAPLSDGPAPDDPLSVLRWYDAGPWQAVRQRPMGNLWVQGGTRARAFFAHDPRRAPTLNKLPLLRWRRGMVYVNSTHAALPRGLNGWYDGPGGAQPGGVLLHTKFLPGIVARAAEERVRAQHFHTPAAFDDYYESLQAQPTLWHPGALRYDGPADLAANGLARALPDPVESLR